VKVRAVNWSRLGKISLLGATIALGFCASDVLAAGGGDTETIGSIAERITGSFTQLGQLILAIAFVAGLGFTMASIFKFKQHKDNPTQIPLGTPIAMLAIGIALIFLPGIISPAGATLFGGGAEQKAGGLTGEAGLSVLPGEKK